MSSTITQPAEALGERASLRERARIVALHAHPSHAQAAIRRAQARRVLRKKPAAAADHVAAHAGVSSVSDAGIALIASFEGFRSKPYWDAIGRIWTVGYGETKGISESTPPMTRAQALARLRTRVNHDYLAPVLRAAQSIGVELRQNEADALASLAYNCGVGVCDAGRTMGNALRSKNKRTIADAFLAYDKGGSPPKPIAGLTRRRRAERAMFVR